MDSGARTDDHEKVRRFIGQMQDFVRVISHPLDASVRIEVKMHPRPSRTRWLSLGRRPSWTVVGVRCSRPPDVEMPALPFAWHVAGMLAAFSTVGPVFTNHPGWGARESPARSFPQIVVFCTPDELMAAAAQWHPIFDGERTVMLKRPNNGSAVCTCVRSFGDAFAAFSPGFRFVVVDGHAIFPIGEDRRLLRWLTHK
jgi:hypothetical protein